MQWAVYLCRLRFPPSQEGEGRGVMEGRSTLHEVHGDLVMVLKELVRQLRLEQWRLCYGQCSHAETEHDAERGE